MLRKKKNKIDPLFLKNSKGKITNVYLDLETYNLIVSRIDNYEKEIKRDRGGNVVSVKKKKKK